MKKHLLIFVILILSFAIRVVGINFGMPLELHPDEGKLIFPANSMAVNFVDSLLGKGDNAFFNPHIFYYGGFPIYLMALIIKVSSFAFNKLEIISVVDISYAFIIGRSITAIFGMLTVYFVYLLASKFIDKRTAITGALFMAFFPTSIILSHYFSPDIIASCFGIVCIYFLFSDRYYLSAIFLGLGIGTKYYPATIVALIIPYILFSQKKTFQKRLLTLIKMGIISLGFFLLTNPHVVLSYPEFIADMQSQFLRNSGGIMGAASPRFLYLLVNDDTSSMGKFFGNSLFSDLGLIGLLTIIFSVIYGLICGNRKIKYLSCFSLFYFSFVSFPISKEMRWLSFEFPILSILVGYLIARVKNVYFLIIVLALILCYPISKSIVSAASFAKGDTRVNAVTWIENYVPPNSVIYSDPILVARSPIDSDKFRVIEIIHNKYNINNSFENEKPFSLDTAVKPFYFISNEKYIDYYGSSDFRSLFPKLSQEWLAFYLNAKNISKQIKCFDSNSEFIPLTGPKICIYFFNK